MDKLHEECGVLGIYNIDGSDAALNIYHGLFALQHRGQQSCGIVTNADSKLSQIKDLGLVGEVFKPGMASSLPGNIGVGHVKYAMRGDVQRENVLPIVSRYCKGSITLSYNGNITNAQKLKRELENNGAVFQSTDDAEVILHLIAKARTKCGSIEEAVTHVMGEIEGAYSMVLMSPRKLLAIRDPRGMRPLVMGRTRSGYIFASETVALDVMHAEFLCDVEPGEIICINESDVKRIKAHCGKHKPSLCVFEYVYFARPDSYIDGVSVYDARINIGKRLASIAPVEADLVIGVPDSGLHFAQGYSYASGIPYGDGLIRNRYSGRVFIKHTETEREEAVNIKLNALRAGIGGKRIIMVDDSIVRGTTSAGLIRLLKENGAKEVHFRVASPPFINACHFGTDIPDKKELISVQLGISKIKDKIGADSLAFLSLEDFKHVGLRKDFGYCDACFTGNYPK